MQGPEHIKKLHFAMPPWTSDFSTSRGNGSASTSSETPRRSPLQELLELHPRSTVHPSTPRYSHSAVGTMWDRSTPPSTPASSAPLETASTTPATLPLKVSSVASPVLSPQSSTVAQSSTSSSSSPAPAKTVLERLTELLDNDPPDVSAFLKLINSSGINESSWQTVAELLLRALQTRPKISNELQKAIMSLAMRIFHANSQRPIDLNHSRTALRLLMACSKEPPATNKKKKPPTKAELVLRCLPALLASDSQDDWKQAQGAAEALISRKVTASASKAALTESLLNISQQWVNAGSADAAFALLQRLSPHLSNAAHKTAASIQMIACASLHCRAEVYDKAVTVLKHVKVLPRELEREIADLWKTCLQGLYRGNQLEGLVDLIDNCAILLSRYPDLVTEIGDVVYYVVNTVLSQGGAHRKASALKYIQSLASDRADIWTLWWTMVGSSADNKLSVAAWTAFLKGRTGPLQGSEEEQAACIEKALANCSDATAEVLLHHSDLQRNFRAMAPEPLRERLAKHLIDRGIVITQTAPTAEVIERIYNTYLSVPVPARTRLYVPIFNMLIKQTDGKNISRALDILYGIMASMPTNLTADTHCSSEAMMRALLQAVVTAGASPKELVTAARELSQQPVAPQLLLACAQVLAINSHVELATEAANLLIIGLQRLQSQNITIYQQTATATAHAISFVLNTSLKVPIPQVDSVLAAAMAYYPTLPNGYDAIGLIMGDLLTTAKDVNGKRSLPAFNAFIQLLRYFPPAQHSILLNRPLNHVQVLTNLLNSCSQEDLPAYFDTKVKRLFAAVNASTSATSSSSCTPPIPILYDWVLPYLKEVAPHIYIKASGQIILSQSIELLLSLCDTPPAAHSLPELECVTTVIYPHILCALVSTPNATRQQQLHRLLKAWPSLPSPSLNAALCLMTDPKNAGLVLNSEVIDMMLERSSEDTAVPTVNVCLLQAIMPGLLRNNQLDLVARCYRALLLDIEKGNCQVPSSRIFSLTHIITTVAPEFLPAHATHLQSFSNDIHQMLLQSALKVIGTGSGEVGAFLDFAQTIVLLSSVAQDLTDANMMWLQKLISALVGMVPQIADHRDLVEGVKKFVTALDTLAVAVPTSAGRSLAAGARMELQHALATCDHPYSRLAALAFCKPGDLFTQLCQIWHKRHEEMIDTYSGLEEQPQHHILDALLTDILWIGDALNYPGIRLDNKLTLALSGEPMASWGDCLSIALNGIKDSGDQQRLKDYLIVMNTTLVKALGLPNVRPPFVDIVSRIWLLALTNLLKGYQAGSAMYGRLNYHIQYWIKFRARHQLDPKPAPAPQKPPRPVPPPSLRRGGRHSRR